jgi:hypothetical protein
MRRRKPFDFLSDLPRRYVMNVTDIVEEPQLDPSQFLVQPHGLMGSVSV